MLSLRHPGGLHGGGGTGLFPSRSPLLCRLRVCRAQGLCPPSSLTAATTTGGWGGTGGGGAGPTIGTGPRGGCEREREHSWAPPQDRLCVHCLPPPHTQAPSPGQDSHRTQICILSFQIWTERGAWRREAPACPRAAGGAGCSPQSQRGFRRGRPDLATDTDTVDGDGMMGTRTAPSAAAPAPRWLREPPGTVHPINVSCAPAGPSGAVGLGTGQWAAPAPAPGTWQPRARCTAVKLAASVGTEFPVRPVSPGAARGGDGRDQLKRNAGPASLAQWIERHLAD